ncbi:T9SS type A sorting domain-containing protein [Chitinophaga sp. XS-30]|nr:T9SS type A sorting domain-containing protein [Chitinophaga sp. XS-30]
MKNQLSLYKIVPKLRVLHILVLFLSLPLLGSGQQQVPVTLNESTLSNIAGYYRYLPAGYETGTKKYPVIVFIHGVGELQNGGKPLSAVLANGIPKLISQGKFPESFTVNGQQHAFIVISPQFKTWPGSIDAIRLIEYLAKDLRIDMNRVYVTGLSMGGGVTWGAISESKENAVKYAAAVPVCGAYQPTTALAASIASSNIPVWALHNKYDDNPATKAQFSIDWVNMINASQPAPNPLARVTIFDAYGHDAWTKAYDPNYRENGMNVYEWMLQYTADREPGSNDPVPPPVAAGKRIVVPVSNSANGRMEIYYPKVQETLNVSPGDTLCIPAGEYEYIHFGNLAGTQEKPIVITNCGGLVKLGIKNQGTASVWSLSSCKFIEIAGNGAAGVEYGFDLNGTNVTGAKIFGMTLGSGSTDFDIHHVFIHDGGILLQAKTLQSCDKPEYLEGSFVMRNVKIHHVKARNAQWEGFYIGNTHYFWDDGTCTNLRSHWIENLEVYDNDLENIGSDGIQISMTRNGNNKLYNNRLVNYGLNKNDAHGYGLLIGSGSSVSVYNNYVSGGYMPGINIFGSGVNKVYNNVVENITYEGISVSDKIPAGVDASLFPAPTAYIYNNTISNTDAGRNSVKIFAYRTTLAHKVYNNLSIVNGTAYDYPSKGLYIRGDQAILLESGNNLQFSTGDAAGLVNAAGGDFHLKAESPAVNTGRDMQDLELLTDYDNVARPQEGKYDVGAFEQRTSAGNTPPIADAGNDMTITLPVTAIQLDGSGSSDPGGSIASYAWKKVSGPAGESIASASSAKTNVSGLEAGDYIFELTVSDNEGLTATDRVAVKVNPAPNKAPVADAGSNITITLPQNTITLNGESSADEDGEIASYAWKKVSGPAGESIASASSAKTNVSGLAAGDYIFELTVADNEGLTATDQVAVKVNPAPNKAPVADAGSSIAITLPQNTVTLNGGSSADEDGEIVSYTWTKLSGGTADIANPSAASTEVSNLQSGVYNFRLVVKDDSGDADTATVSVVVNVSGNNIPKAIAGSNVTITLPQNSTVLDGSSSSDPDGDALTYWWLKVTGPSDVKFSNAAAAVNTVTQMVAGVYVFQLLVTDPAGMEDSARVTITVLPEELPANKPPVANAGENKTITLPINTLTLTGASSSDPDGTITAYQWTKISGPSGFQFSNSSAAINTVSHLVEGVYIFRLTVTDSDGAKDSAQVTVTVLPGEPVENKPPVAVVEYEKELQLPNDFVEVDGRNSSDPDGVIQGYAWKQLSGPARVSIVNPGLSATRIINLTEAGNYMFELTVTDDDGATGSAAFEVIVLGDNQVKADTITAFPTPASNVVYVDINFRIEGKLQISVYNMNGELKSLATYPEGGQSRHQVDISNLPNGYFILELRGENGFRWSRKILKIR